MKTKLDYGTKEELDQDASLAIVNLPEVLVEIRQALRWIAGNTERTADLAGYTGGYVPDKKPEGPVEDAPGDDTDPALGRSTTRVFPESTCKGEKYEF